MSIFAELKRRNVFRVGIAYLVGAWVLLQIVDFVLDAISAPNWILQVFILAAAVGLPVALIVSWVFEMTPEGIKRESHIDRNHSVTPATGRKLDRVIIAFMAVAILILVADRFLGKGQMGGQMGSENHFPETAEHSDRIQAENGSLTPDSLTPDSAETGSTNTPAGGRSGAESSDDGNSQQSATNAISIAVLPFVNMSSDPEQEYFSDGLAEELLNSLAQNDNLRVAARTSAFQFKGQNLDVAEIGRQLKVENVLEGSVRKSGSRLRITAQLIKVADGFHVWSETYEREMDDIFAIQDEISGAISTALELKLGTTAPSAEASPTKNLEAYNLYLRGRYLLAARGGENMLEADKLFERAVALDPEFSAAWSAMAFNSAVIYGYTYEIPGNVIYEKAVRAAHRAIELDPQNAEAYIALARAEIYFGNHWQAGQEAANRAYELAPNNAEVVNIYGDILVMLGDFEAAERIERKATTLDPLSATDAFDVALLLLILNRPEEALEPARTAMDLAPDSYFRVDTMIYALLQTGRYAEGKALIEETIEQMHVEQQDPATVTNWWNIFFYESNDPEGLRANLSERLGSGKFAGPSGSESTGNTSVASFMAFYVLWLDGADAALPWLQQARANREWMLIDPQYFYLPERISTDPVWVEFWNQPEYQELFDIRRSHPNDNVGYWKDRPAL